MLDIDAKQVSDELCDTYGPQSISKCTVFTWIKAFKTGNFVKDTHLEKPKTSITKANIAVVKGVVEQNARLLVKDIAR